MTAGAWPARLWRGPSTDPRWARPALLALLVATGLLYLWGLGASGWANSFYSAAVQAGTKSWKAGLFGSSDAANFITVDKAPGSLWVAEVSTRIFGVNSWAILVPQALEGVAAVGVLYATVKRWSGPVAGLIAGAVLATTPVSALIFRFNNPDALLVLLLVLAAYATIRALEAAQTRWVLAVGAFVGLAFLAKMLQAFLVIPVFGLLYLVLAPTPVLRRVWQLLLALAAMVVSAGWWIAVVQLTPARSRPYVGGSQDNSIWNLMFGYNGFGRLTGNETGSVGGGPPGGTGAGRWGTTGWSRMFGSEFGSQVSWLLPAALVLLVAGLVLTWRAPLRDRTRAALLLWGGWLLVTAGAFSYGKGIIHPYYSVALAPAIGALVGVGGMLLWAGRDRLLCRGFLAAAILSAAWWSWRLLIRVPAWHPDLRVWVLVIGAMAAALILLGASASRALATSGAVVALVVVLAGPTAYSLATAATPHTGAIPSAGPQGAGGPGGFGGPRFRAFVPGGGFLNGNIPNGVNPNGVNPNGNAPRLGRAGGGGGGGGLGGLLDATTPSAPVTAALLSRADAFTWVAAVVRSNPASGYQLATGRPVMAIGGFNGTDPAPTLAQFQAYVRQHRIHYFIGSVGGASFAGLNQDPSASTATQITNWVTATFTPTTIDGVTLYDLTNP